MILLLLMLVVGCRFLLFQSYVHSQKSEFRKISIENRSEKLQHLMFAENDLYKNANGYEWKHHNKELVINGQFHEVLAVIKKQNGYEVIIITDNAENELFKHFFASETNKNNSLAYHLIQFLQLCFFETTSPQLIQNPISIVSYPPFNYEQLKQEHLHELIKPPAFFIL
jgi:hypothetical protein